MTSYPRFYSFKIFKSPAPKKASRCARSPAPAIFDAKARL